MTPEIEADLRTTVASLRVKASCLELLLLAVLPTLQHHQKEAIRVQRQLSLPVGVNYDGRAWRNR
jgi:hypothetical protein